MILLYCIASFLVGAWVCSLFKKTVVREKELPYEQFDPLAVYKDNQNLRREAESLKSRLGKLENSDKFYSNKFRILQQAAREKNNEFVIHELQRMNYEEENRPIVCMSGFSTPIHSSSCYTGKISYFKSALH